jgi:quercetin 2,3-dioxygenase
VGPWCFLDHYGPDDVSDGPGMQVGAHPHAGLQTVTWLLAGEVVHHDSLGNVQPIRPGQLNLMTAGRGIAHAERSPSPHQRWLHGVQLWVAMPDDARTNAPGFEHHPHLPALGFGGARGCLLIGELAGERSPATAYSPVVGADLEVDVVDAEARVPLDAGFEHALVVVSGAVRLEGTVVAAGGGVYLGRGRSTLSLAGEPAGRILLLGGEPFAEPLVMWWNFVGRSGEEMAALRADWEAGRRFGAVAATAEARIPAPGLPPGRMKPRS